MVNGLNKLSNNTKKMGCSLYTSMATPTNQVAHRSQGVNPEH